MPEALKDGFWEEAGSDNVSRITAYRRLWLHDDEPAYLTVAVSVPRNAVIGRANKELALDLIVFAVTILLTFVLILFGGRFFFLNPIGTIIETTKRLGKGDLRARSGLSGQGDELGELANSIDSMAQVLETSDLHRKNVEQSLRESEEKYRQVFVAESDGLFLIDTATAGIVEANEAACRLFGYASEEIVTMKITDLSVEPEATTGSVKRGEGNVSLRWMRRKDGSLFPAEIGTSHFVLQGRRVLLAAIRDITEGWKAQEELRGKTALLEAEVNASPVGILVVDKGKKVLQNRRMNELFQVPSHIAESDDDAAQIQWVKGLARHPEEFDEKAAHMFAQPDMILHDEFELADGRTLERYSGPVIGSDGTNHGRLWMFYDITGRKKAAEALEASERRLSEAIDLAEVVYWEFDSAKRTFIFNDPFYSFFGTTAEREGGYRMSRQEFVERFVHPDDRWMFLTSSVETAEAKRQTVLDREHRIVRRDGEIRFVHVRTRFVQDEAGRFVAFHGSMQNITEQKKNEESLRLTQTQLTEAMNLARIVYWDSDVVTSEMILNDSFYALYGTAAEKEGGYRMIMDEYIKRFVHPDDQPLVRRFAEENSSRPDRDYVAGLEHRIVRRDRQVAFVRALTRIIRDDSGRIVSRRGANQDITELKRFEEEISMLKHSIDVYHDGAYWLNTDKQFIYVNEAACEMVGYTREELLGSSSDVVAPSITPQLYEMMWGQLRERGSYEIELVLRRKDGSEFPADFTITYVQFGGSEFASGIVRDITERKRAQSALIESETRYRTVADNTYDWEYWRDPRGRFIYCSPSCERVTGYSAEQFLARPDLFDAIIHPDHRNAAKRHSEEKAQTFQSGEMEFLIIHSDGTERWIGHVCRQIYDTDGRYLGVRASNRDVTSHKQAEAAMRESEERLRLFIEHAPAALAMFDRNMCYLAVSRRWMADYGLTDVALLGRSHYDVFPEITDEWKRFHQRGLAGEVVQTDEDSFRRGDGSVQWLRWEMYPWRDDKGSVGGIVIFTEDITERKRVEVAFQENRQRLQALMDAAPVAVEWADKDGRIEYLNIKHRQLFGYDLDEIPTVSGWYALAYPDPVQRASVPDPVSIYAQGEEFVPFESTVTCKDGSLRTVIVSAAHVGNTILQIFDDITARKELESQLRQSQKMEAIGTLAGGIAHDFNNVLTVISGFSSLLKMDMKKNSSQRRYIDQVLAASEKAAVLTQGLLAFSRKQQIVLKPLIVNDCVQGTSKLLARLLTDDIQLKMKLSEAPVIIMADRGQIDQILFNLVANARDAMPQGGTLTIETAAVDLDSGFRDVQEYAAPGRYALISVSDTGYGMDQATREKIFDPFFTTKAVGKGTGLGLSTVYGIVKQHKGYISVFSEPRMGTVFSVYLPVTQIVAKEDEDGIDVIQGGKEKILLAEDDGAVRAFFTKILETHGYTVVEARDGQDAVEKFKENPDVELLVFDSVMPTKNGREAYDEINAIKPDQKIIFMSGYTRDVFSEKGIEDTNANFLQKPVSPLALLRKVREVLDDDR